jgi:amino acid transporter
MQRTRAASPARPETVPVSDPSPRLEGGSAPDAGDESERRRLDRELIELLNELRVVLTGVQVLFAFLLTLPFTDRFHDLVPTQRLMFSVAFTVTAMASVLLIAPTAYHRLRFRQQDKERMLRWANRFAIAGIGLLAFAIGTIMLLVIDVLYSFPAAGAVAGAVVALIAWTWFALPLSRRLDDQGSDGSQG